MSMENFALRISAELQDPQQRITALEGLRDPSYRSILAIMASGREPGFRIHQLLKDIEVPMTSSTEERSDTSSWPMRNLIPGVSAELHLLIDAAAKLLGGATEDFGNFQAQLHDAYPIEDLRERAIKYEKFGIEIQRVSEDPARAFDVINTVDLLEPVVSDESMSIILAALSRGDIAVLREVVYKTFAVPEKVLQLIFDDNGEADVYTAIQKSIEWLKQLGYINEDGNMHRRNFVYLHQLYQSQIVH